LYKFFDLYYIPGYLAVNKYFKIIREKKIDKFNSHFDIIKWIYIIIAILLCLLLFLVIYSFKIILTSFLNFIAILPIHYLIEDEDFYEDVVKLEKKLY
jgi:accessory gene regulator protein AgrB